MNRVLGLRLLSLIALGLLPALGLIACATAPAPRATPTVLPILSGHRLATLWYPWFGFDLDTGESVGGLGSSHWNTDAGSYGSRVGITDEPEWGFYASDDPAIIAEQLDAMKQAGIDTILASWWGWGDSDLDGELDSMEGVGMNRAVATLFNYVQTNDAPFKLAVFVEPFMPEADSLSKGKKQIILDYVWDNYYSVYSDLILQWDGKPLLGSFAHLSLKELGDGRFTHRIWGSSNDPFWKETTNLDWCGYPDVDTLEMQISDDGVIILFPRFDEYWAWVMGHKPSWTPRRVDPLLEEGIYEQAWQVAVDNKEKLSLIIVYSWNEHGDHSAIEPTKKVTPLAAGWSLVEKTAPYWRLFQRGENILSLRQPNTAPLGFSTNLTTDRIIPGGNKLASCSPRLK